MLQLDSALLNALSSPRPAVQSEEEDEDEDRGGSRAHHVSNRTDTHRCCLPPARSNSSFFVHACVCALVLVCACVSTMMCDFYNRSTNLTGLCIALGMKPNQLFIC